MSRPRCFGKSLLVATLEAYFPGKYVDTEVKSVIDE
ncbi:AAA family ATPase [Phocaeicola faecalis]|nr:AAA family ATPase [Phocaeicola faecalis]